MKILDIRIHHSLALLSLFMAVFLGGFCCLFVSSIFLEVKLLCGVLTFLYAYLFYQRYYCLSNRFSVNGIICNQNRTWSLCLANGLTLKANLNSQAVVTRYLIVLHFNIIEKSKHISVLLLFDSTTKEKLRELRKILQ